MRIPVTITEDLKRALECKKIELESIFVVGEPANATIIVSRVNLVGNASTSTQPILKFSKSEHAIPTATHLMLGTLESYRNYEGEGEGIRDEQEGRYDEDVRPFFSKYGQYELAANPSLSGHVTYGVSDSWLFCTSLKPTSANGIESLRRAFSAECVTEISDPSEFARELGASFAAHSSWSDVDLGATDILARYLRPPEIGDKVVWVYHGPVLYSNDVSCLIDNLPSDHQATTVPFQKRTDFSDQREYRFSVQINGTPRHSEYLLPISPELRRLTSTE